MSVLIKFYLRTLERHPMKTQALTTGILMGSGDAISQFFVEKKTFKEFDTSRTTRFFLFGTFVVGPLLRKWYTFIEVTFRRPPPIGLAAKIAADQLLFAPSFLLFFLGTMTVWSTGSTATVVPKVKQDYWPVLMTNYKLWPAAQVINFYIVPLQHRVLYANVVALFWNVYLAYKTSKDVTPSSEFTES